MFRYLLAVLILTTVVGCEFINPIGPILQIGVFWMEGEASKYYNTDQTVIQKALKETLTELKLPIISEETKDGVIHVKAGDDDRFKIKIVAVRENITKLSIRVNTFGDNPYAELIYRHVDAKSGVIQFVTVEELNTGMEKRPRLRNRE